jgi:ornithine--oxo-acid transaminase
VLSKETHETVIRFAPPLTITTDADRPRVEIFRHGGAQKHRELGLG